MAFHINSLDLTIPDNAIIAANILYNSPEYSPSVSLIADTEATLFRNEPIPVEYSLYYNLEPLTPSLASEATSQNFPPMTTGEEHYYHNTLLYINSHKNQGQGGGTNLTSTSIKTVEGYGPDPWTQVQRAFLHFLVKNPHFLQSLPDSTPCSIARVKQAFEQNMPQYSLAFNPSANLDIIIQQFKAEVTTPAIRRECDLRKKNATSSDKFYQVYISEPYLNSFDTIPWISFSYASSLNPIRNSKAHRIDRRALTSLSALSDIAIAKGLGSYLPTVWTRKLVIPPHCQLIAYTESAAGILSGSLFTHPAFTSSSEGANSRCSMYSTPSRLLPSVALDFAT
ncbi:hypothetical protein BDN70DRAFT_935839 [Pholiota conissans]|uniref:Uncharacterized protein n=1 Tax=Pholiota conissans TaxID=109636 RepID=A0A9P5YTJ4_9AGAR|nr:hypothetical protein BDN70DRAFT_935839 [Pholiota conissans]